VLTVVPLSGPIEVQAMIANKDIGFVQAHQEAVIKIEAFPFTRYGSIDGEVVRVSRDAVDQRDSAELSDAATAAKPHDPQPATAGRTQDLVFPATISLAQHAIPIEGREVELIPGMAVTVEIKTGKRRVIDYLLSPLREFSSRAGRER
jgi:hemolysin D